MSMPVFAVAAMVPATIFAAWLFLHKSADVDTRIDKRESLYERESAEFDKDFAAMRGDKEAVKRAEARIKKAEQSREDAIEAQKLRRRTDQREALRESFDDFLRKEDTK